MRVEASLAHVLEPSAPEHDESIKMHEDSGVALNHSSPDLPKLYTTVPSQGKRLPQVVPLFVAKFKRRSSVSTRPGSNCEIPVNRQAGLMNLTS